MYVLEICDTIEQIMVSMKVNVMTIDYDKEKWLKVCNTTLCNYINMEKRLSENKKLSDFVLVYYSIFFIVNSLTAAYFACYNVKLCEYFGIILSVVMLAYSFINSNANYARRIDIITNAINQLKTLKRDFDNMEIDLFKNKYNSIVDNVEFRNDVDFFKTIKSKCKELGVKWYAFFDTNGNEDRAQLKNYLSEISPYYLQLKLALTWMFKLFVIALPPTVILLCFIVN